MSLQSEYELVHDLTKKRISEKKTEFTLEEKRLIKKIYRDISGKSWKGCSSCWQTLYMETSPETITNKFTKMSQRKFHLQPGKQIALHGVPTVYTEDNLTDEAAIMILKKSRSHLRFFSQVPENVAELLGDAPVQETPAKAKGKKKTEEVVEETTETEDVNEAKEEETTEVDFSTMTKTELQGFAASKELPEAEWKKLGRDKLQVYLESKLV